MKKIEIGKAINYGWKSVKKDFWYFVAIAFIYEGMSFVPYLIKNDNVKSIVDLIVSILGILLIAGFMKISLDYFDGKKAPIGMIFKQFKYFWNVLGAMLLIGLITLAGLLLLVVPGIIWSLKYQFVINLIVDKDLGILEAMKKSAEMTKGVKLQLLVFGFAALGLSILGYLALGVGSFVTFPIIWLADIYVYRKLLES